MSCDCVRCPTLSFQGHQLQRIVSMIRLAFLQHIFFDAHLTLAEAHHASVAERLNYIEQLVRSQD